MSLVSTINTGDKFLASATIANFKNSSDTDRYKSFTDAIVSARVSNDPEGEQLKNLTSVVFDKLKNNFGNISTVNKNNIFDMVLDSVDDVLDVGGNLFDRSKIKSSMTSICGGFDAGMFNKHGGSNSMLEGFTLSALLSGLLCMGIKGALTVITAIVDTIGFAIEGVVNIISSTLDTLVFNPINNVFNGITTGAFKPINRTLTDSGIDISGMLGEIADNVTLTNAIKSTPTAYKLLAGYTNTKSVLGNDTDTSMFEYYADTLLPDWKVSDLATSLNPKTNILDNSRSTVVSDITGIFDTVTPIDKKDFMMII